MAEINITSRPVHFYAVPLMLTLQHSTPVDRLPAEILAEIYSLVPSTSIQLIYRGAYPWRLALVCKLWRDIAFSTPHLWSNVTMQLDPVYRSGINTRGDSLVAVWKLCLERSGGCPLNFSLRGYSSEAMALIPRFLEPLMAHTERWQNIVFDFPITVLLPFISNPDIQFPYLRYLFLTDNGFIIKGDPPLEVPLFERAPLLSRVTVSEFHYSPFVLKLPWSQVTELKTCLNRRLSIRELLQGLRNIPNISILEIDRFVDLTPKNPGTQPIEVVQLPQLRKLLWKPRSVKSDATFFDSICAPQLSELDVHCANWGWDPGAMQQFLCRSQCSIKSLTLHTSSSLVVSSFLSTLPDLEVLTLHAVTLYEGLIEGLKFDRARSLWVAPKLKKMILVGTHCQRQAQDGFAQMAQSRLRVPLEGEGRGSKLECLEIRHNVRAGTNLGDIRPPELYLVLQERLCVGEMKSITHKVEIIDIEEQL